ncbi:bifunctional diguanylate cyclase/phosphodiesterase [Pseudolabrys sp. FHR47]|uniref:putative bifunctional diguanylate cyclase/phosphodiesterase n=1 Tax=Pseudolabrys sp. FHR47 TaxID=2562284 RepID=UPI0010BEED0A|nr:EAL domain-containing protein [Pseudolabrys sp. FHR47]
MTNSDNVSLHALQTEILEAMVTGERFEVIAERLCLRAEALAPGAICTIVGFTNEGRIKALASPSLPASYGESITGIEIGPEVGSCGTVAYRGEPVEVDDIATSPLWESYRDLVLPLGLQACWSYPIKTRDGRVAAAFGFYFREKRGPTVFERSIVSTCVHLCSIAIEHALTQKRNHALAYYDQLTGLPNRRSFDDMMFDRIVSMDPAFGLLVVDIDNLKIANDTMGHVVGDSLIQEVAARLSEAAPNGASRIGGDEFAVLIDGCRSHAELAAAADRIVEAMKTPFDCAGYTITPQITMGGVVYELDGVDPDLLRQNADFAIYHAKSVNRGGYALFKREMRTSIATRMSTIRAVGDALNESRVLPFYQPLVTLSDGTILGFEALARIRMDNGAIVSAGQFQAALSDPSIAFRLTDQMLGHIARDMRGWLSAGFDVQHVGINLSTADFHRGDIEQRLMAAFEPTGVPLDRIVVEVTEGVFMDGTDDKVVHVIESLRRKGITVALDDFGTGFASLTHLIRFPVDTIKIDKSFVDRMLTDHPSQLVVELLVDLSRKLHMHTVAEGIETQAQAGWLKALGCDTGQGYYFGRPVNVEAATKLMREWQPGFPQAASLAAKKKRA